MLRGYSELIDYFRSFVADVIHFSGKFSTTGKPLYANFHLREDECVTKIDDETPVNAKNPSPSDVIWDFGVRSTQTSYLPCVFLRAIGVSHTACKDEFRQNLRFDKIFDLTAGV